MLLVSVPIARLRFLCCRSIDANLGSPFSQRVWIALEAKGLQYQYCEEDPYKAPASRELLEANPRGTVPAIRQGDWACAESGVILEYVSPMLIRRRLEDVQTDYHFCNSLRKWTAASHFSPPT